MNVSYLNLKNLNRVKLNADTGSLVNLKKSEKKLKTKQNYEWKVLLSGISRFGCGRRNDSIFI